ncbi:hypothetical protein Q3W71_14125 [Micromonospora sp. C28SCA-DRY-2]|uniref:hypothetical protein n=1 Tax=Micromonospora sp. C28SCA-DRY-2 TaxID=3059522 RepID=UPI002674E0F9|nr:hypothetical protein [Micromonospora sp. C28SCA-DRY-2]MDO3702805.1 hypothetical protein [Micromonospora sp. C28SCA-DRY-2]
MLLAVAPDHTVDFETLVPFFQYSDPADAAGAVTVAEATASVVPNRAEQATERRRVMVSPFRGFRSGSTGRKQQIDRTLGTVHLPLSCGWIGILVRLILAEVFRGMTMADAT